MSLPLGWEEHHFPGPGGRRYFVVSGPLRASTWVDPLQPMDETNPLPMGWECRVDSSIRWFYFNKHHMTITYEDPRLPHAGKSSPVQLQRGNIPSEISIYGEIPPAAACVANNPPLYSPPHSSPPVASTANSLLAPVQKKPSDRSFITLPGIESLSLEQSPHDPDVLAGALLLSSLQRPCQGQPQSKSNTPTVSDAGDEEWPPHPQIRSNDIQPSSKVNSESNDNESDDSRPVSKSSSKSHDNQSNDSQPVSKADSESNGNQCISESENETTGSPPTSESEPKNNEDDGSLMTSPVNKDFKIRGDHIHAIALTPAQLRREKRKLHKRSKLKDDDDDETQTTPSRIDDSGTGDSSVHAKNLTLTQIRRARRKVKKLSGKSVPEAVDRTKHPISEPDRDAEPLPGPDVRSEPTLDKTLPRYRLVRAYGDSCGAVLYYVLGANCVAEEVAPHYYCLTWHTGDLHYHAAVDSHPNHVRTSDNKLDSFHRGLQRLDDVDYLIIEFPNRTEHGTQEVNYTEVWADLYRARTFEDAIRIGRVVKMPCPEGCTLGSVLLGEAGHTLAVEEATGITPLAMMETKTRASIEEAGLCGDEKAQIRFYNEFIAARSPSMTVTTSSVDRDVLLDQTVTGAMPALRRILPNLEPEDLRRRLGEALRGLISLSNSA